MVLPLVCHTNARQIAPAVAAGNTVVFKSSEKSPLGMLYLGALFKQAGFPSGVINLLSGGAKTGAMLASHMDVAKISFTGSLEAGRQVQIAAAKSNLKMVTLELGGKSASIVFNDAHLENAVLHNSQGFLVNSAQVCCAGSRILVQEDIAETFVSALKDTFIKLTGAMGDPSLETTFIGPLADEAQGSRVRDYIDGAEKEGIEVLVGGTRKHPTSQFVQPTILFNPNETSRVYTEEIFGPVVTIKTFRTEEQAIAMANNTAFGLSGKLSPICAGN